MACEFHAFLDVYVWNLLATFMAHPTFEAHPGRSSNTREVTSDASPVRRHRTLPGGHCCLRPSGQQPLSALRLRPRALPPHGGQRGPGPRATGRGRTAPRAGPPAPRQFARSRPSWRRAGPGEAARRGGSPLRVADLSRTSAPRASTPGSSRPRSASPDPAGGAAARAPGPAAASAAAALLFGCGRSSCREWPKRVLTNRGGLWLDGSMYVASTCVVLSNLFCDLSPGTLLFAFDLRF